MSDSISVYHLTGDINDIREKDGKFFDAKQYSRMKHGNLSALKALGREVGVLLSKERPELFTCEEEVMFPVVYKYVPPSCYYLALYACEVLNETRIPSGLSPARITKVLRTDVDPADYATFTKDERKNVLATIGFETTEPVDNAHLVLVDDIRITGLVEKTTVEALAPTNYKTLTLAYLASVDEDLAKSPHVEYVINHAEFKDLHSKVEYIVSNDYVINIRSLKISVGSKELPEVLPSYPTELIQQMLDGAKNSGADFIKVYSEGINALENELSNRKLQTA